PDDKGKSGDGRSKVHRFRSHWLELGRRLRDFRTRYGLTQGEIARVVRASDSSTVAQWESELNVPDGIRRERLIDLLKGRRWLELVHGLTFELTRSVVPQLPLRLLDVEQGLSHDDMRKTQGQEA